MTENPTMHKTLLIIVLLFTCSAHALDEISASIEAAEQGEASAQINLGAMYDNGDGVAEDDVEAVHWFRKSAEQGDADAQYNLGLMYYYGEGVAKDSVQAYAWIDVAAAQGIEESKTTKNQIAKGITIAEITKAQKLSRELWQEYGSAD